MNVQDYDIRVNPVLLKAIRQRAKLTQKEAAQKMGISLSGYLKKETGEERFKDYEKFMMKDMYHMSFQEFDDILYGGMLAKSMDENFFSITVSEEK